MILLYALLLVDIHTLFVLLFSSTLPMHYVFTGFSIAFIKGLFFYLMGRDLFSLIDIIMSILMLLLLFGIMPLFLKLIIFFYLVYKIWMSLL